MAVENTDGIYYTEVIRAITAALQAIAAAIAEIERAFLLVHDSQTARGQKKLTANPGSTSSQEDKMIDDGHRGKKGLLSRKALFLDRDGTLIRHKSYLCRPEEVEILPGIPEALQRAIDLGYLLFMFTNQSGIGRGYFSLDAALQVNARMEELLGMRGPIFAEICMAPETSDDPQVYRKPSPRFILEMIEKHRLNPRQCYMIGDSRSDVLAGINAGITAVAVTTGIDHGTEGIPEVNDGRARQCASLSEFVAGLESEEHRH